MDDYSWHMSDKLTVDTNSYIVKNLVPNVPFTFQVLFTLFLLITTMFPLNVRL